VDWKSILILRAVAVGVGNWIYQIKKRRKASQWPLTEATVESGEIEVVAHARDGDVRLPMFAFSYKIDANYYSGRFALFPYVTG
jgi:hypothetical protein